nr:intermediate filament-like protein 1 [Theama mediterranea]
MESTYKRVIQASGGSGGGTGLIGSSANNITTTKTVHTTKHVSEIGGGGTGTYRSGSIEASGDISPANVSFSHTSQRSTSNLRNNDIHPIASQRSVIINRAPKGSGGLVREVDMRRSYVSSASLPSGNDSLVHHGINNIVTERSREKKDMQDLNERFGNYIEKVRFLEVQNRKLANELNQLREKWGKETERIKQLYDTELAQLRKLLEHADRDKADLQVRLTSVEDQLTESQNQLEDANRQHMIDRETLDKMNTNLSDLESEVNLLRRRVNSLEEEKKRVKKDNEKMHAEILTLRMNLDNETVAHINAENEAQSLRETIEFMKQLHDSEMKELAALAYRDTTAENREFWKSEMSQAIHDIQSEYDSKMDALKNEMESYYNLKVQEFRTNSTRDNAQLANVIEENKRIKAQLQTLRDRLPDIEGRNHQMEKQIEDLLRELEDMRRDNDLEISRLNKELNNNRIEMESVLQEMQTLLDAKLSLELEIAAYRKLLEGEEARVGLRSVVDMAMQREDTNTQIETSTTAHGVSAVRDISHTTTRTKNANVITGEVSAKTTYSRTARGNIVIQECSPDGKFIILENTSNKKKEDITGWKVTRVIDNGRMRINFTIPSNTTFDAKTTIKIWAKGQKPFGSSDMECNDNSWGTGNFILTTLSNQNGEERATHTQNTTYGN